jgi:CRISPR-associated protein, Cas2 family
MTEVRRRLGKHAGNIQLFTFPDDIWNARRTIEQGEES